jgi:hypothetical protein
MSRCGRAALSKRAERARRRAARYANALAKANYASLALRPDGGAGAGGGGGAPERGEEDDEELQATLARARRAALAKAAAAEAAGGRGGVGGEDALASRAAARREADERERTAEGACRAAAAPLAAPARPPRAHSDAPFHVLRLRTARWGLCEAGGEEASGRAPRCVALPWGRCIARVYSQALCHRCDSVHCSFFFPVILKVR